MSRPTRLRYITRTQYVEISCDDVDYGDIITLTPEEARQDNTTIDLLEERFYEAYQDDQWVPISYNVLMFLMVPVRRFRDEQGELVTPYPPTPEALLGE